MLSPVQLVLLSLFSLPLIRADTVEKHMVISNVDISPDGFRRSTVLAGGTFPGVVVRGQKGDRFRLNVVNELKDDTMERATSIHWHGIFQNGTNWADGTTFITQCPITPKDSFLYDFTVEKQAGTYWYHSHLSTQYCDGLRGAFIVGDPNDPHASLYDVDDESTIITLADWYHVPAPSALVIDQVPPASVTTLINGKGRYTYSPSIPLAVINVEKGKRYRFRLIAMACDPNFTFSIDNHFMTVIEADGENTVPLIVDSLQIFAGQRYSVIVHADKPTDNYWIRAEPNRGVLGFAGGINTAILRYAGAPATDPATDPTKLPTSLLPLNETALHVLQSPSAPGKPFPGGADVVLNMAHVMNLTTFHFKVNGVMFEPPTVPVLLQILSGAHEAQDLLPKGSLYLLPPNKVIELSLPGTGLNQGGPHPFHLHGHSFSVIRSADSHAYNFVDPVRRDTVGIGLNGSNATIRFVTDNAGPWLLHCHIDWHLKLGLAIVFAEDIPDVAKQNPVTEEWKDLCPKYNEYLTQSQ